MKRCGAKTRNGTPCQNFAMPNGRCRLHGGKSLKGKDSPQWKDGRYSKYLPDRMMEKYQQSLSDPALLQLSSEIALIDSRLADVLQRVDTGESGRIWKSIKTTWKNLNDVRKSHDYDKYDKHVDEMNQLIKRGYGDWAAWDEIGRLMEQRRKLVESERKRMMEADQYITNQQALILIGAILAVIREHVPDTNQRQSISNGISRLIAANPG